MRTAGRREGCWSLLQWMSCCYTSCYLRRELGTPKNIKIKIDICTNDFLLSFGKISNKTYEQK